MNSLAPPAAASLCKPCFSESPLHPSRGGQAGQTHYHGPFLQCRVHFLQGTGIPETLEKRIRASPGQKMRNTLGEYEYQLATESASSNTSTLIPTPSSWVRKFEKPRPFSIESISLEYKVERLQSNGPDGLTIARWWSCSARFLPPPARLHRAV